VSGRGVRRYVEDLLNGQRPRRFPASAQDAAELRAAIELRAARPGDDGPRPEFVGSLHRRLSQSLAAPGPPPAARRIGRRGLAVGGLGIAAASAAVGVLADRALVGAAMGPEAAHPAEPLAPTSGEWRTVTSVTDLPEGAVQEFDGGPVAGFVERTQGAVTAVSAICTHQGCRLSLDPSARRLDCPCHATTFAVSGEVVSHHLPTAPAPLPRIATREVDGAVQVFVARV